MQFLHTIYCVIFNNLYNQYRNCYLFFYSHWYLKNDYAGVTLPYWNNNLANLWMGQVKEINIKNRGYSFCDDMINIKNVHSILSKIDKKFHEDIDTYYIGYIMITKFSDCENIHSVNPLCFIIHSATGHFKEKYGEK